MHFFICMHFEFGYFKIYRKMVRLNGKWFGSWSQMGGRWTEAVVGRKSVRGCGICIFAIYSLLANIWITCGGIISPTPRGLRPDSYLTHRNFLSACLHKLHYLILTKLLYIYQNTVSTTILFPHDARSTTLSIIPTCVINNIYYPTRRHKYSIIQYNLYF